MSQSLPEIVIWPISDGVVQRPDLISPTTAPTDIRQKRVDEFFQARSLAPKSKKAYQRDLQYFMDWSDRAWESTTPRQVAQFKQHLMQERGLAGNSVNRCMRTLKTFYKWMVLSSYATVDPTVGIQQERVADPQSKELEDDQVELIFKTIAEQSPQPVRDRALFFLLLHGLRAEEVCNLNVGDYNRMQVMITEAKHNSIGEVPLSTTARIALDQYLRQRRGESEDLAQDSPIFISHSNRSKGKRLTYWGVRDIMDRLAQQTGIEDLHAHRGRHTFATNLVVKVGMDPVLAMELTRHKDVRSFRRYTNRKNKLAAKRAYLQASDKLGY